MPTPAQSRSDFMKNSAPVQGTDTPDTGTPLPSATARRRSTKPAIQPPSVLQNIQIQGSSSGNPAFDNNSGNRKGSTLGLPKTEGMGSKKVSMLGISSNGVFKKVIDNRTLYFINEADYELGEELLNFKNKNPATNDYSTALCEFVNRPNIDAVAKLIYGDQQYDMIIKYFLKDENSQETYQRRDFQYALMKAGLFLETEPTGKSDEFYLKVVATFECLCNEAESSVLRLPMIVSIISVNHVRYLMIF